ncbi:MAG: glycine cleavage system protein GcvH [Alphaproteobacteria bacterium]
MSDIKYAEDHEWIRLDGDTGTIGISVYAQEQLGDVVYVELPKIGQKVGRGDQLAVVESVKAASEVFAPVSGEVVEINADLVAKPEIINEDAEGLGWFARIKVSGAAELDGLMDKAAYADYVKGPD